MSIHERRLAKTARLIRAIPGISRPELAARLELNLSSASSLVHELVELGLVCSAGHSVSSGGRPAARLEISGDYALAVGAEVSHRGITACLVSISGEVVSRLEGGQPRQWRRADILESLSTVVSRLLEGRGEEPLLGIGVGVAGVMGEKPGVSREFPHVSDWRDVDIAGHLAEAAGELMVEVDNDVRAATLAELRFGAGRGLRDLLYLHIGRGIALGVVTGGRLHRGAFRAAGELGHFQVNPDGPVCYCGSSGCLESLASPTALLSEAVEALRRGVKTSLSEKAAVPEELTVLNLFEAAAEGDRLARNLVERAGEAIGRITAGLDNVLDPQAMILGGLLADRAGVLADEIVASHKALVMPVIENTTEFRPASLGIDAPAIGAATLVFDRVFRDPVRLLNGPGVGSSRKIS